jgi:hypothetical protein
MRHPIPKVSQRLSSAFAGHFRYYVVPLNQRKLKAFKYQVSAIHNAESWNLRARGAVFGNPSPGHAISQAGQLDESFDARVTERDDSQHVRPRQG